MTPRPRAERLVVGAMSGTSLDGIDAALALVTGRDLRIRVALRRHAWIDLGPATEGLRGAAGGRPMPAGELADLALALGGRYAEAIEAAAGEATPDLVAVHGQTIIHRPPISWQIINPAPIAQRFGCPVVYDLRQADLAAGGQGAPITPLADWVLFRDPLRRRAVVNLGGFCNLTVLPRDDEPDATARIAGFDICACNQVLDEVARRALGAAYDEGGRAAASGTPRAPAAAPLREILEAQRNAGRSLGTGDEARHWVDQWLGRLEARDLAASAVDAIAGTIAGALAGQAVDEVIVAGGGARHAALVESLRRCTARPVAPSDAAGVPGAAREALAMAVLGALCADGVAITLPQVTGCRAPAPIAGAWLHPAARAARAVPSIEVQPRGVPGPVGDA